jgi:hypothetical protein
VGYLTDTPRGHLKRGLTGRPTSPFVRQRPRTMQAIRRSCGTWPLGDGNVELRSIGQNLISASITIHCDPWRTTDSSPASSCLAR